MCITLGCKRLSILIGVLLQILQRNMFLKVDLTRWVCNMFLTEGEFYCTLNYIVVLLQNTFLHNKLIDGIPTAFH